MGMADTKSMQPKSGYGYGNQASVKGADSSDNMGMPREKMRGGVAMGMKDACGADNQFNTGRTKGVCYTHTRADYK